MIEFKQVTKRFGPQVILENASFTILPGSRVGIVGPNGAGKSTLFSLITGEQQADQGDVLLPKSQRLGHVRQYVTTSDDQETLLDFTAHAIPELARLDHEIHEVSHQLETADEDRDRLLKRLGDLQESFEHLGGYSMRSKAEAALGGLGFKPDGFDQPFASFSGGWQMRAELARALISDPSTLLLDEPSNYLDLPAVEWLQFRLREFQGTLLLISHDRFLLEALADTTLEVAGGMTTLYKGSYSYYTRERQLRIEQLEAAKKNQDRQREQVERFVERFRAKNTKASQVQSRIKQLEKMEDIQLPRDTTGFEHLRLPDPPHSGSHMIRLDHASFSYDGTTNVLNDISLDINRGDKTAVVGYNGMGKTTLLKLICGTLNPTNGKRKPGHKVVIGYQSQEFADTMPPAQSAFQIVKDANEDQSDKEVRTILGGFGFSGDEVYKTCEVLSGGEKIRLAFARIFADPPNLLILDEPTTHLDIKGRIALEEALVNYAGAVCVVSHDITFVRKVATSILAITPGGGVARYHGGYDYYREKSGPAEAVSKTVPVEAKPQDKKAARKERAEQRKALSKDKRRLEKVMKESEQQLEKLEAEQAELVEELSVMVAEKDYSWINQRLKELPHEIETVTAEWEDAATRLEELG